MKLVRVLSESPAEATDLVSFLDSRGFVVHTTDQQSDLFSPSVDFEIDLRVVPMSTALQMAQGLLPDTMDVFTVPDVFTEAVLGQEASAVRLRVIDVSAARTRQNLPIPDTQHVPSLEAERLSKQSNEAASIVGAGKRFTRVHLLGRYRLGFTSSSQLACIGLAIASLGTVMFLTSHTASRSAYQPTQFQIASPPLKQRELPAHAPQGKTTPRDPRASTTLQRHSVPKLHRIPRHDDDEVIVRHYDRPTPKSFVAENSAGNN